MNVTHDGHEVVGRLGFGPEQVVLELGWDDDTDPALREGIETATGGPLEDDGYTGSADASLLWWRAEDGDLADGIVDAMGTLVDGGFIVVCTPRPGRPGALDVAEIDEAATTAGMHTSGRLNVGADWTATRVVAPRHARR